MRHLFTIIILTISSCSLTQTTQQEMKLDLSGQKLKEIPDSVFQKQNLTYLDLGSKSPISYPPLSALVDTNANLLTEIPNKIGRLTKLTTLILNSNQLTRLPDSIINLSKLEILDLSLNRDLDIISEIEKIKHLPNLKILKISETKISRADMQGIKSQFPNYTKIILS